MTELEYLLQDPLALRILIDGHLTGKIDQSPPSASGFPLTTDQRALALQAKAREIPTQSLQSRLIGDIGPTEYRLAQKVVKTYETQFKGLP